MDPLYLLLICVPVAALITWRLLSGSHHKGLEDKSAADSRKSAGSESGDAATLPRPQYRAMTLRIGTNACAAAKRIRHKSFLVGEVPRLPLPNCDRACHCEFASHDDRRIKDDRRFPSADGFQDTTALDDGRAGNDRRSKTAPYQGIY